MSAALSTLLSCAGDRTMVAREWVAEGKPVFGYVGADVPVEMLTTAGVLPLRLAGSPGADTSPGDRCLGRGTDPAARSVLTGLLEGAYGPLDGLVVASDCEASRRLFYAVRELRRRGEHGSLPPAHLVDVLHTPRRATTRYVCAKLAEFRVWLHDRTGQPIDADALAHVIGRHDELRRLLGRVRELRRREPPLLTGAQALGIVAAATAVPVGTAIALVARLLAEVDALPPATGTRVFVTGSGHDTPAVYEELEREGLCVVGEDHDWGDRWYQRLVGGHTELALAEYYQRNGPAAARAAIRLRAEQTAALAMASRAEALLCYARQGDTAPPWDFAEQRARTGLPSVSLVGQPYGGLAPGALEAAVGGLAVAPPRERASPAG